ncbi:MAG: hypothetical protein RQ754_04760 [Desulfuromonadales bacterium]|nr:hypothetical protein [Desulfuromonadales bacterium]
MPTDHPMAIMFLIFLSLFILLGTSPVLHRLIASIGGLLGGVMHVHKQIEGKVSETPSWRDNQLDDYEIILLRKLAMAGGRGLSRRMLIKTLYFKPQSVDRSLHGLVHRGVVRTTKTSFAGARFCLSTKGQEYALEQDLVPRYQLQSRGKRVLTLVR